MRGRRLLSYRDAVAILGGDSAALAAADQVVGGALSAATGGASDAVLGLFGAQGRVLRTGRDATAGLRARLGSAQRADRTEKIAAAHAVLVITAFFEAAAEADLPFDLAALELTRSEQLALAGAESEAAADLVQGLLSTAVPQPSPAEPFESTLEVLREWYWVSGLQLWDFVRGLALWDRLDETERGRVQEVLRGLDTPALNRYQELYAQLALEVPEFGFWSGQVEHQATRVEVRRALRGVDDALAGLAAVRPLLHAADGLTRGYRQALGKAILAEGKAPSGVTLPTLEQGYVDPDFRVRAVSEEGAVPADEDWWTGITARSDLTEFLAGTLTTVASTTAPLLVLGQPGAGKSVLTKILASRLPGAGYFPVRVVLREVPAEVDVQDQIEHAVRAVTGERVSWPELVRAADGAVPVLLFDGFDELLQATGVNQTDYLVRIAKFQQREADQGRPVYAMVTSRTAVADRARCPEGTIALRLEPFREAHVTRWLEVWNDLNAPHFAARGLDPLTPDLVTRHEALASQPLLLLMLALYDATTDNALGRGAADGAELDEAALYEELLSSFAVREIGKLRSDLSDDELDEHREQELQRLSLISFGMLNRRRQWITTAELDQDLAALLGCPEPKPGDFRTPLGQADIALGRFFFVQRSQAVQDDEALTTYEFLHATFGEYLAARLAVQLVAGLLAQPRVLALGPKKVDDDLLYTLLSYSLLASRQMLRFVEARLALLSDGQRQRIAKLLVTVMEDARERGAHPFADYRPIRRATASRHGKYEANLIMLTLLVTGGFTASELFPDAADPAGVWPFRAQLWRSALTEQEWTDFSTALEVSCTWVQGQRELEVRRTDPDLLRPEAVDPYWLFRYPPGSAVHEEEAFWRREYWYQLQHKMSVSGGTNDSLVRHALDPMFRHFGAAVTTFHGEGGGGAAASFAHDLMDLWLAGRLGADDEELTAKYRRCARLLSHAHIPGPDFGDKASRLIYEQLAVDCRRLPVSVVLEVLNAGFTELAGTQRDWLRVRIAMDLLDSADPEHTEAEIDMLLDCLEESLLYDIEVSRAFGRRILRTGTGRTAELLARVINPIDWRSLFGPGQE
ncbi:NACHT domain-containing protein [Streptomyces sp. NPDC051561]|uniref:NACHT domain-containing protein n=1 Tax=Streptomyces sp. NPDC051561 TaxID=3365658 RepID=UPI0037971B35